MKTLKDGKVVISKSLFSEIKRFYCDIFSEYRNYNKDSVTVLDTDILKLINNIKNEVRITSINFIRKIDKIDKSEFEKAYENYTYSKYDIARNKFENISNDNNAYDHLIENGLKLIGEMNKIKSFPALKNRIVEMINEIKSGKAFNDIKQIENKFQSLCLKSGTYEEYQKLARNLSRIIGNTYKDVITDPLSIQQSSDFSLIVSDEEGHTYLLNKANITSATYGVILSPDDNIKFASNEPDKKKLMPYSKLNKKENYLEVEDFKPIACFAVTLGEKTLNENYRKAQKLSARYHNLPLYELDISRFVSKGELKNFFKDFINQLLDDKNINFSKKDDEFYHRFEIFYKEYSSLKQGQYDEGRIRNLFHVYINLLTSSQACDLDILLKDYKLIEIETVLKYNTFMDDNIFRYKQITKPILERFIDKFYKYRADKSLNQLYPGFSVILNFLKEKSDDELKQIVEQINSQKVIDSWLLAQLIDPSHIRYQDLQSLSDEELSKTKKIKIQSIEEERKRLLSVKESLSAIEENKNERKAA